MTREQELQPRTMTKMLEPQPLQPPRPQRRRKAGTNRTPTPPPRSISATPRPSE